MKSIAYIIMILTALNCHGVVTTPEARSEKLENLKEHLDREIDPIDESAIGAVGNPFSAKRGSIEKKQAVELEIPEDKLLGILAEQVQPTGAFAIGGEYTLLFKEKRAKAGAELSVVHNAKEYTLLIKQVFSNGYILSLGNSELQVKLK